MCTCNNGVHEHHNYIMYILYGDFPHHIRVITYTPGDPPRDSDNMYISNYHHTLLQIFPDDHQDDWERW